MDSRKCAVRQTRCLVLLANQVSSGASTQVPVWSFFECTTAKLRISLLNADRLWERVFAHHKNSVVTGIETYTEKNLPSESYSAVDYRIGRIVSWGRCDKRKKQKNPLRSLPLYDESSLDYEYIHPIKWIPEISLSVLTLSLLLAIRWRT